MFEVTGYEIVDAAEPGTRQTKHFKYLTKNVVLATGNYYIISFFYYIWTILYTIDLCIMHIN